MKKFLIYIILMFCITFVSAYLLETYGNPGCPNPKCCNRPIDQKTFEEQQVCDQGT